jgi:hypothetical protein
MATEGQGSSRGQGELFQSFNVNVRPCVPGLPP